jgi:hypothetical protein
VAILDTLLSMSGDPLRLRPAGSLTPEAARELVGRLVDLVTPRFPLAIDNEKVRTRPWSIVGPAIIARSISTVESIAYLSGSHREADPLSLLRDLVEGVINFGWLAAAPETRVDAWEKDDMGQRLKLANHAAEFGEQLLEPAWRAELERKTKAERPDFPRLDVRARGADDHWASRISHLRRARKDGRVFSLLYATIFRYTSAFGHSMPTSINRLIESTPNHRVVVLEGSTGPQRALTFAPVAFGLMLYVADQAVGWPAAGDIDRAFDNASRELRDRED